MLVFHTKEIATVPYIATIYTFEAGNSFSHVAATIWCTYTKYFPIFNNYNNSSWSCHIIFKLIIWKKNGRENHLSMLTPKNLSTNTRLETTKPTEIRLNWLNLRLRPNRQWFLNLTSNNSLPFKMFCISWEIEKQNSYKYCYYEIAGYSNKTIFWQVIILNLL